MESIFTTLWVPDSVSDIHFMHQSYTQPDFCQHSRQHFRKTFQQTAHESPRHCVLLCLASRRSRRSSRGFWQTTPRSVFFLRFWADLPKKNTAPDHSWIHCQLQCTPFEQFWTLSKKLNEYDRYEYFGVPVGTAYNRQELLGWVVEHARMAAECPDGVTKLSVSAARAGHDNVVA
jgi:hypothetical protein